MAAKKTKILLINPPVYVPRGEHITTDVPLGLAYVAAALKEEFDVRILDCVAEGLMRQVNVTYETVRVGMDFEEIMLRIAQWTPQIVGISMPFSESAENALLVAQEVKKYAQLRKESIIVVMGGPHASAFPEKLMELPEVDFVVIGEGEEIFYEFCHNWSQGTGVSHIQGLAYRDFTNRVVVNPRRNFIADVSTIDLPARDMLQMQKYFHQEPFFGETKAQPHTPVIISRGCPGKCVFCSVPRNFGEMCRMRTPQDILDELEFLTDTYQVREIHFVGDNLFYDLHVAREVMKGMIDWELDLCWAAPGSLALWEYDPRIVGMMKKSNCYHVWFGIEAGVQGVLQEIVRSPGSLEQIKQFIHDLKQAGIKSSGFINIGYPGETIDDMLETMQFARSLELEQMKVNIVTPVPGSALWDMCIEKGYIDRELDYKDILEKEAVISTERFTEQEVLQIKTDGLQKRFESTMVHNPSIFARLFYEYILKRLIYPFSSSKRK